MKHLEGKTAVVTGAGRGLGLSIARRLAQAGAQAILAERDAMAGEAAAEQLRREGAAAAFEPLDVREPAQSQRLVEKIASAGGAIEIWVNNAGVARKGPAETLSRQDWEESLAVMLSGAFYCSQAVGQHMLARGRGVIVNVASINAFQAVEGRVAYSAAKAGLVMLTRVLGVEWASRGVRVVGIAPGVVMTEMVQAGIDAGLASLAAYERRIPMRRLGSPEEIAEAVYFLASGEAAYIVGETIRVDGGWLAYQLF
jgi:NAD(P)-dependent dehydrogenase (short-subunit alcohol dehydrogenase family)